MKIGLVGATSQEASLPFNAEDAINCYAVMDKTGKEVAALYGTPGLYTFATLGNAEIRAEFLASNGRAFAICGSQFYEVDAAGNTTLRGTLLQSSGIVYVDENTVQIGLCDGVNVYMMDYATNAFAQVIGGGLPASCGSITFIDSFFIVNENGTGKFFKSAPNDGTSWNALDFATAESSPDNLKRPIQIGGNLFLMGDFTGEIWTNTGASAFPFQKVAGGKMNTGIYAPASALEVDNTLFWVGRDKFGFGIVYRANGFTPKRISTTPVERIIKAATDGTNIRSYSYEDDGHLFYVLTGGGLAVTLVYDVTTDMWHKRAYLNPINGAFEQHLGACYMNAFGKHLVGDRNTGRIYVMDQETYDDNGDPLAMERIFTHISDEEQRIRYNNLVIGAESGVGTQTGQGYDPVIELQLSYDGARTWSDIFSEPIGKAGEYLNKCEFRQIGLAAMLTIKIRMTDPVPRRITGSYLS